MCLPPATAQHHSATPQRNTTAQHHSATPQRNTTAYNPTNKDMGDGRKTAGGRSVGDGVVLVQTDTHACVRTDNAYSGRRARKHTDMRPGQRNAPASKNWAIAEKQQAAGERFVGVASSVLEEGHDNNQHKTDHHRPQRDAPPTNKQRIGR